MLIYFDNRWNGKNGIGRFSAEILEYLTRSNDVVFTSLTQNPFAIGNVISLTRDVRCKKADVFFSPNFNTPLFTSVPMVFVLHDLIPLQEAAERSFSKIVYYNLLVKRALKKAAMVITVSDFSKQEIIRWSGVDADKIAVCYNGVDSACYNQKVQPYFDGTDYFLYVGNYRPHKNLLNLLHAFSLFAKTYPRIKLIISGNGNDELRQFIKNLGIIDRVSFIGVLSDEQLAAYYRGAIALVFASFNEGFGLPIIEAMACGTPVITSNISAMPEVAGGAALLVDPYSVDSIYKAMVDINESADKRQKLSILGLERAKYFTWEKTCSIVSDVLSSVVNN